MLAVLADNDQLKPLCNDTRRMMIEILSVEIFRLQDHVLFRLQSILGIFSTAH